jgi:plastocyanin
MLFNNKLVAFSLLALVGSAAAAEKKVIVGNNTLKFYPEILTAEVGDTIVFEWPAINKAPHSVVQAVGKDGTCEKKVATAKNAADPKSGPLVFNATGAQNASYTFNFKVADKNPIWFYCGVPTHCTKGMYGVINPPAGLDKLPPPSGGEAGKPSDPSKTSGAGTPSKTGEPSATSAPDNAGNGTKNDAPSVARSGVMLGVVAIAATFLL